MIQATTNATLSSAYNGASVTAVFPSLDTGAVASMLSIGHRTGLFDVMAQMPPATSSEIANRAELAERYVREWLAVMVTGRIVRYDPARRTYYLPPEHAVEGTELQVMYMNELYPVKVAVAGSTPLFDPTNERMK